MRIDHLGVISRYWDSMAADYSARHPEHRRAELHPSWGLWHVPETELSLLDRVIAPGKVLVDLGCGPGHDARGFARLGLRVIAIDISREQLANAVPCEGVDYRHAAAEALPIEDHSADIVVSDHGAFDHSPAALLLGEVRRILKPGGTLVVCTYSPFVYTCYDKARGVVGRELLNPYPSGTMRSDGSSVNSEHSYSSWIKLFADYGFSILRLEELFPAHDAASYYDELVPQTWSRSWPTDIAWVVRAPTETPQDGARNV